MGWSLSISPLGFPPHLNHFFSTGSGFTSVLLNINDHSCALFSRQGPALCDFFLSFPPGEVNHYASEVFIFTGVAEGCFLWHCRGLVLLLPSAAGECSRGVIDHFLCVGLCIAHLCIIFRVLSVTHMGMFLVASTLPALMIQCCCINWCPGPCASSPLKREAHAESCQDLALW